MYNFPGGKHVYINNNKIAFTFAGEKIFACSCCYIWTYAFITAISFWHLYITKSGFRCRAACSRTFWVSPFTPNAVNCFKKFKICSKCRNILCKRILKIYELFYRRVILLTQCIYNLSCLHKWYLKQHFLLHVLLSYFLRSEHSLFLGTVWMIYQNFSQHPDMQNQDD